MKKLLFILLFAFFLSSYNHAQVEWTDYGYPNTIKTLCADGDYVWVGTLNGLYKRHWNGTIVAHYTTRDGLAHSHVVDIEKDPVTGALWVGTYGNGVSKYQNHEWTTYNSSNSNLYSNQIEDMTIGKDGNLWVATYARVQEFTGTEWLVHEGPLANKTVAFDIEGNLWTGTWGNGLFKFDGENWIVYTQANSNIGSNYVVAISNGLNGDIWLGHYYGGGVSSFDGNDFTVYTEANSGLGQDEISKIIMGNMGDIYIITYGSGISVYYGSTWVSYTTSNSDIVDNRTRAATFDVHGNLWVGTEDLGMSKFDGVNWVDIVIDNAGIHSDFMQSVHVDHDNKKWFLSYGNGLAVYNDTNWLYNIDGIASNYFYNMTFDKNGVAWIVGDQGVFKHTGSNWIEYSSPTYNILGSVESIGITSNDSVWIGYRSSQNNGAAKFNGTDWVTYDISNSDICANDIIKVVVDRNDTVWFCSNGDGVSKYCNGVWTTINTSNSSIASDVVYDVLVDEDGNQWFATQSGLSKFDGVDWTTYTSSNSGLVSNFIRDLELDNDKMLWVATTGGASKFDRDSKWTEYNSSNSLILEQNLKSIAVDQNNQIWLLSSLGVSMVSCQTALSDFITDIPCYPSSTSFTSNSLQTDVFTEYQYNLEPGDSMIQEDFSYSFSSYGSYNVTLITNNWGCIDSITKEVQVNQIPEVDIFSVNSDMVCLHESTNITSVITNKDTLLDYDYLWSTGSVDSLIVVSESDTYELIVKNEDCESVPDNLTINVIEPFDSTEICMVTVDEETQKNKIIWERDINQGIESYNIYKVYGTNYIPVGNVPFGEMSIFIDYSSTPDQIAARYAISVVDTCGNESLKSPYHQTIHLGASQGAFPGTFVLDWTDYIDESNHFIPDYYYIYRGETPDSLDLIQTVSGIFTEWNDNDPGNDRYYLVSVEKPIGCIASDNTKANNGPFSRSLSNLEDNRQQTSGIIEQLVNELIVFPNPMHESSNIKLPNPNIKYNLLVKDISGKVVMETNDISGQNYVFNRNGLYAGYYMLELQGDELFRCSIIIK